VPRLRHLLGTLLAAALLAAQQLALEHAIWHAGAAQASASDAKKPEPARNPLCSQHDALGAVLGAIGCAPVVFLEEAPVAAVVAAVVPSARAGAPLQPSSRGPPALL